MLVADLIFLNEDDEVLKDLELHITQHFDDFFTYNYALSLFVVKND